MIGSKNELVRADQIKHALAKKHHDDVFLTEVKTGATWTNRRLLIFDALAIKKSWTKPCITGYEVKVSRSDFMRDDKWPGYLQYCHRFYFACPRGLIQPGEVPDGVGLIWYNPETGSLNTRKATPLRPMDKLPVELLYYIVMNRTVEQEHPFFTSRREYLEAWVEDRAERGELGIKVQTKLARDLRAAQEEADNLRRQVERLQATKEKYDRLVSTIREAGVKVSGWGWEEELVERLRNGAGRDMRIAVQALEVDVQRLKKIVGG